MKHWRKTFVLFMSIVFENVRILFLGTWVGGVHFCLLFGAVASFTCLGMCGIFKTDFHVIRFKGNTEWKQNARQVSNWRGLALHASTYINAAWAPHTSCSAWPLFTWKCLLLLPFVLQVQCLLIAASTVDHSKFSHGSEIWRNANLHQLRCPLAAIRLWHTPSV